MGNQDIRRVLILAAGLPGVGKSTISRKVSAKIQARTVDIDDFKRTEVDPALVAQQIDPPEIRWRYYQKALEYVSSLFDQGVSVVVMDEVFHLSALRAQMEALCAKQNVQVLWVEVRCPYATVEKRLCSQERESHILSTAEALNMHLMFREIFEKFPANAENHLVIDNEDDANVDALVEKILERC
ncbi:MAG: AAA family ATPase [Candidatus Pacebacteria bacterium]|nr:AAA family ATPase [Candidatus Paceibacterota bacterium]MDD5357149.1 AAA family ATPase [Candidatus Paceibacterota bacterium]